MPFCAVALQVKKGRFAVRGAPRNPINGPPAFWATSYTPDHPSSIQSTPQSLQTCLCAAAEACCSLGSSYGRKYSYSSNTMPGTLALGIPVCSQSTGAPFCTAGTSLWQRCTGHRRAHYIVQAQDHHGIPGIRVTSSAHSRCGSSSIRRTPHRPSLSS